MITKINTNNNNRKDVNKLDVALAGSSGLISGLGAAATMGTVGKVYYKKVLLNQPVMFNEEAEHFKKLQEYLEKVIKVYDPNSDLTKILNNLKNTGEGKQELINSAYAIYNSNEAKEARLYSDEFLNIGRIANSSSISDEELIKHSENLLQNKQLNQKEKDILTEFLEDPTKRKNVFSFEKINFFKIYKSLSILSQNVIISPKLITLANQMSDKYNLKGKGITYMFGSPERYEQIKQEVIANIKTQEEKILKEIDASNKNNIVKKINKIAIKLNNKRAISKITRTYTQLINGTNAFYFPGTKIARVPLFSSKREAIFHELGHSINNIKSKNINKMITFLKHKLPFWAFTSILLSSVFLKKSNDVDKRKGIITKTREFIKNNIASIALVVSAPKLLEEGIASTRGVKFLKGKVTPQQLKNIKIKSLTSLGSYGINALTTALALKFAVWISDKIQTAKQQISSN